jgi:flagellar basal body-associated protein FliL
MQQPTKKSILIVLIISAVIAISVALTFYFSSEKDSENIKIKELVEKYNKNCPLKIQEGIRLDSVTLPREKVVQYNLTLVNVETETAELELIEKEIGKSIANTIKANPGLEVFRENDYTLIYQYSDKNKKFMFDVKAQPEQYK